MELFVVSHLLLVMDVLGEVVVHPVDSVLHFFMMMLVVELRLGVVDVHSPAEGGG